MPGAYCYHEPLADNTFPNLLDKIDIRPEPCVGIIDTSAHQKNLPKIDDCYYFVLLRDMKEIYDSLRLRGWVMNLQEENRKLQAVANSNGCISIHYRWLNDIGYLRNLWGSIVGSPFDEERAEYLMEMNVQRKFASVKERVDRCLFLN
jgi:hypothetical protein